MRNIDISNAPDGDIICHSPDGSLHRLIEPDYWQLVTLAPIPAPGSEAAFGEFKQAGEVSIKAGGLTVRDYFAAKAMQGFAASPGMIDSNDSRAITYVAAASYAMADAMLAERAK
jgi:hypothetical protein